MIHLILQFPINQVFPSLKSNCHIVFKWSEVNTIANSSTTQSLLALYMGLGWNIATNFGTEAITKDGAIDGYYGVLGFNPTKQIGFVILCTCDERDVPLVNWYSSVQFTLLNPSSIFTSGKVPPITNANTSVVSQ